MLNFRQIEVFRAIMITKSVNGAARLLHTSQPGLSRILFNTESKLGIKLFERKKGRLIPTPEGLQLFEQVQLIYRQIKNLDVSIEQIIQGKDQILRVGSSPSIGRSLVPYVLRLIKEEIPSLEVDFTTLTVNQIEDYVSMRIGDVALCLFPPEHPTIEVELLTTCNLVAVMLPTHDLADNEMIGVEDLKSEPIISFQKDTAHGRKIEEFFHDVSFEPKVSAQVRFAESACALVESGFGIALVDEFTVMNEAFPALQVKPLVGATTFSIYLLKNNSVALSSAANAFCTKINSVVKELASAQNTLS